MKCITRPFRFIASLLLLSLAFKAHVVAQAASEIIPAGSKMAAANPTWQRILLSPLESDSKIGKAAFMMTGLGADVAPAAIGVKGGAAAMSFHGDAQQSGAKADFNVTGSVSGSCKMIGFWAYRGAESNVASIGLQVVDAEGEYLKLQINEGWTGWKWFEFDLTADKFEQAYPQGGKNSSVDFPLKAVNIIWFSEKAGPSTLVVDTLVAIADIPAKDIIAPLSGQLSSAAAIEPGQPFQGQYVLSNFTDKAAQVSMDIVLQRDPLLTDPLLPDATLGADHALGAKSRTEYDGKVIEEGSLTDGNDHSDAKLPWDPGKYTEAFQFVDLGKVREIINIKFGPGDANWVFKLDVLASTDGKDYKAVEGLQGFDMHGKWGANTLPLSKPLTARFLKFRWHNNGTKTDSIAMPSSVSIYDGPKDEKWAIPALGQEVYRNNQKQEVPARSFAIVHIASSKPVEPGSYALDVLAKSGDLTFVAQTAIYTLPLPLKISPKSAFGMNGSDSKLAPLLKQLGVGWFRFENLKWCMVSPAPGKYAFDGTVQPWVVNVDQILKDYTDQGIGVVPMMFVTPDYASSAGPGISEGRRSSYPPKDNDQAAEFYAQTAARYGGTKVPEGELKTADKKTGLNILPVIEVWNEENLNDPGWGPWVGSMDQYYEMFRKASEAVRKTDKTSIVSHGGFGGADEKLVNSLVTYKYADGKTPLDFTDILNLHYYSGRVPPELATMDPNVYRTGEVQGGRILEEEMQAVCAWRDAHKKGMPIWMTETGFDSEGPYGLGEKLQAARIPRVMMLMLGNGVDKVFLYREVGSDPSQHSASGVLRNDGSFKPSFFTYATLIRQLDGTKNGRRISYPDKNVRVYAWDKEGETMLSAWAVKDTAKLDMNLGKAKVVDSFSHEQEANITAGFPLTEFPVYIHGAANLGGALKDLQEKERLAKAAEQKENERLGKLKAYLFNFAGKDEVTLKIGTERPFKNVLKDSPAGDFGFVSGALNDDAEPWLNGALNKTFERMEGNGSFAFTVDPGNYQLRICCPPLGAGAVSVTVAVGSQVLKKDLTAQDSIFETDLEVKDAASKITVTVGAYAKLRWLTLIDKSVSDYPKPNAE